MPAQTKPLVALLLLLTLGSPALRAGGKDPSGEILVAEPMPIARLYCDPEGESRFVDEALPFSLVDFAPPAPPISVSEALAASAVTILSSPPGWHGDWHPAPARQLMFVLSGELEVEVTEGEIRRFTAGATILVEDISCRGHVSRVVGDHRVFMANIPLTGD